MSQTPSPDELFFTRSGMDESRVVGIVGDALRGADDGELFMEYRQSEALAFDDGRLKTASYDVSQGIGIRRVVEEATAYAHASELSEAAVKRAADTVRAVDGRAGEIAAAPTGTNRQLYGDANPLSEMSFDDKVRLLQQIDSYLRDKDDRVRQVTVSLTGNWQVVCILRADGSKATDVRPLIRLDVSCVVGDGDRMESGSMGTGGRMLCHDFVQPEAWQAQADEALRCALVNLKSIAAPAGEMQVVLGPGWPAVLLHEAIGHGLEGDFNRKKTSAFSGLMGKRIASPGVTVVDNGTIADRRGSLAIDDEGTPTSNTVLIEDGILTGYMHDRMNARLMGHEVTGNGRRESYAHQPIPRMTNTYMLSGDRDPEEIVSSVKKGLYAVNFGGGQVDITNGKFVFSASEAYLIENGKVGPALKGATLIGNGPDVLTRVSAIGNDMALDKGIGTCGKAGQGVPVGVGQPTMLIEALTVGGTQA
ncbi:MAG: metalloprotease TldD [Rhodospirillales bacterium]|nr:metalloprotease TldD [Rhodospirillales bacterium]